MTRLSTDLQGQIGAKLLANNGLVQEPTRALRKPANPPAVITTAGGMPSLAAGTPHDQAAEVASAAGVTGPVSAITANPPAGLMANPVSLRSAAPTNTLTVIHVSCLHMGGQSATCLAQFSNGTSNSFSVSISANGNEYITH